MACPPQKLLAFQICTCDDDDDDDNDDDWSVWRNKRELSIIVQIVVGRTDFLVSDPSLETVQRHRLIVVVELIGEQFTPS